MRFIVGDGAVADNMPSVAPMRPFSDIAIAFLNDLSKKVMSRGRAYSDVFTFGFWCRRSALLKEKSKYDDLCCRLGKGVIFHSTPSNVPVNFAFSFAAGLLAGNANIVRLPALNFEQVNIICAAFNDLLEHDHKELRPYICMVKYPTGAEITDKFSSMCDVRVIWGGDDTIAAIRKSPLSPRATDITFADRYSIAVIDAPAYLASEDKDKLARNFYNDTYFSDQNACTSPRIIFWIGEEKESAKKIFWKNIHDLAKKNYALAPVQSVGKLAAFYRAAAERNVRLEKGEDCYVTRVNVDSIDEDLMRFKYNSGFFFEYDISALDDILPACAGRCQTLTYYGLTRERLTKLLACPPRGVDRIVPIGTSMDFSLVWDGYDLIRGLSRKVSII
ncbi:hypothetical protein FACS1894187_01900 [Synergistales bacterium]|nr:hypothetical protein FACS1894187_01900 [Synergistales bacterium]